jgi:hypothetical protein
MVLAGGVNFFQFLPWEEAPPEKRLGSLVKGVCHPKMERASESQSVILGPTFQARVTLSECSSLSR